MIISKLKKIRVNSHEIQKLIKSSRRSDIKYHFNENFDKQGSNDFVRSENIKSTYKILH